MDANEPASQWNFGFDKQGIDPHDSSGKTRNRRGCRSALCHAGIIAREEETRQPIFHVKGAGTTVRGAAKYLLLVSLKGLLVQQFGEKEVSYQNSTQVRNLGPTVRV